MGFYDDALAPPSEPSGQAASVPLPPQIGGTYSDALTPPPEAPAAPEGNVVYRSGLLPLSRTDQGKVVWDWGSGLTGDIGRAFTLPARVASGEMPMPQLGTRDPNAYNAIVPETLNMGQMFSPINPMVRSGSGIVPGVATDLVRPLREAPSASDLRAVGGAQMDAFEALPIRYNPAHIGMMADRIEGRLIDKGIYRDDANGIYSTLDRMRQSAQPPPAGATVVIAPSSLHSLRQNFGNKYGVQGEHQLAPGIATEELDKFITAPPPGAVLARPPSANPLIGHNNPPSPIDDASYAGDLFARARGNLAASYRGADIADLARTIDLKTAAAHSGRNLDNTTRAQITQLLLDDKQTRGFTTPEKDMLEGAVYGDATTNRLRDVSKKLGGGGGFGATAASAFGSAVGGTIGMAAGLPPYVAYPMGAAIPPYIGRVAGELGAARTQKALLDVGEATRRRSPLFQEQPLLPMQTPSFAGRDAIARTLMMGATPAPPVPPPVLEYDPNRT